MNDQQATHSAGDHTPKSLAVFKPIPVQIP